MSLQTTYLANGNWTTRRVDISELLNDNNEQRQASNPSVATPKAKKAQPIIGMLSQTIIQSPTVRWVLPARLRHKDKQDVVFVGDYFIQIRESVGSGHLEDVVIKADFDTKILSAKVINVQDEVGLEAQIKQGATYGVQGEQGENDIPPHVLVLALDSKELVFLFATELADGRVEFVHNRRPLPADVSLLEQYGRHVAVDPRSRAFAISASQDYFGVFSLKPHRVLQTEMRSGNLNPIWEERFLRVDGDILKMEFLHPKAGEDKIILLLLIAKEVRTYLVCYEWETVGSIRSGPPKVIRRQLPLEEAVSSVLVPLRKEASFMMITSTYITIYNDFTDMSQARKRPQRYPIKPPGQGDPHRSLLWTQWARPMRNWMYSKNQDGIYLCREDSKILYVEVGNEGEVNLQHDLGKLDCDIDTGFTILDRGFEGGDLLVAAGNMSDGGVFVEDARQPPRCIQSIPNWAPVLDSVVLGPQEPEDHSTNPQENFFGDRIFACSGPTVGNGAVTELRHGLEARIGLMIEQEDPSSILNLWAIPDALSRGTLFFSSTPDSSLVLFMPEDARGDIYAMDEETLGADLCTQTLAAGGTHGGVIIQVTSSSINLAVVGESTPRLRRECQTGEQIIAAAVAGDLSLLVVAVRKDDTVHIRIGKVGLIETSIQFSTIGQPLSLPYEPICLSIETLGSVPALFVGTSDGKILVSYIDSESGLGSLCEQEIVLEEGSNESKTCESLALISAADQGRRGKSTLFCGLRSGNLVVFDIHVGETPGTGPIELRQGKRCKLGETTVRLRRAGNEDNSALVACGDGFWRVSHAKDGDSTQHILEKVWVTDHNNPSYLQSSIDVFTCVDKQPHSKPSTLDGSLVCIVGDQLLVCTLDKAIKPVPRRIPIRGSPKRMVYSQYLKKLVVGYSFEEEDESSGIIQRFVRPQIDFIDPDSPFATALTIDIADDSGDAIPVSDQGKPTGAAGEKITALIDWNPTDGKNNYHMIVVGTERPVDLPRGRLIYVTARPRPGSSPQQIDSTVKYVHNYEEPIRSMAPYGSCSLVFTTGKEVILQKFDLSTKRWRRCDRYQLESPGVSISVREPHIYISTTKESLVVLKVSEDNISLFANDGMQRGGLHHTRLQGGYPITMTSSRGGSVVGLSEMGVTSVDKTALPAFKANMQHSSVRLLQSKLPPTSKTSQVIYGTTIGGSVYRFAIMKEHEWRLLRFIQNVCMIDPIICPFSPRNKSKAINNVEPSTTKPDFMHINGDILGRLTAREIRYFKEIISREDSSTCAIERDEDDSIVSAENERGGVSKLERFVELVPPVLGAVDDPFTAVMEWMVNILQIAF